MYPLIRTGNVPGAHGYRRERQAEAARQSALFDSGTSAHRNQFRFGLKPDVFIALTAQAKVAGEAMIGEDVCLVEHSCRGDEMEPTNASSATRSAGTERYSGAKPGSRPRGVSWIRS